MDIGQLAIVVVCAVLGVWYLAGAIYNRRRGMALARWLQAGLRAIGAKAEYRWIGSAGSGLRASAGDLAPPLRRLDAIVLLETRELLLLWIFQRLSGRRDQLILRIALRRGQKAHLDAAPRVVPPEGWSHTQVTPTLQLTATGPASERLATALRPFFERYGPALRSFSYRPEEPQLVLALNLVGIQEHPAEEIIGTLAGCL